MHGQFTKQYLATDDTKEIHFVSADQGQDRQRTAHVDYQQDILFHHRCPKIKFYKKVKKI
jgi:hypothetical protein